VQTLRRAERAFIGVAVLGTAVTSYFAFSPARGATVAFWVLATAPTLALAAFAAAWAKREELLRDWLWPEWGDFTRGLAGAVVLFGLALGFSRLVAAVGSTREIWLVSLYAQVGDPRVLRAHGPEIALTISTAAIAEELVWRGAVTQLLAERVGSRLAWVWAAGLYALAYAPSAWSLRALGGREAGLNPALVAAALGGGLVWGGMARRFGRLTPSILAHALFDWAVLMMFPLWGPGK
jgi:uncharacterized protein